MREMKELADGKQVSARSYYYLLDWNEVNEHKFIQDSFNKIRLCDLFIDEYKKLFHHAANVEYKQL